MFTTNLPVTAVLVSGKHLQFHWQVFLWCTAVVHWPELAD